MDSALTIDGDFGRGSRFSGRVFGQTKVFIGVLGLGAFHHQDGAGLEGEGPGRGHEAVAAGPTDFRRGFAVDNAAQADVFAFEGRDGLGALHDVRFD